MTKEEFEKLSEELKMDICREIAYEYAIFVPKDEPRAISKFKSIVCRSDKKFFENDVLQNAKDRQIFPYDVIMAKIEKLVESYYHEFKLGANARNALSNYGERGEKFKTYFEDCLKSSENTTKEAVQEELFRRLLGENDAKTAIKRVGDVVSRRTTSLEKLLESLAGQMEQFMILCESQDNGFTGYRIRTNGDNCKDCTTLDGKIFSISEIKLGVNVPPFHPNCDCAIEILDEQENAVYIHHNKIHDGLADPKLFVGSIVNKSELIQLDNKHNDNVVKWKFNLGTGLGVNFKIAGIGIEVGGKRYYEYSPGEAVTENISFSVAAEATDEIKVGTAITGTIDATTKKHIQNSGFAGIKLGNIVVGWDGLEEDDDIKLSVELEGYIGVGAGAILEINLSEIIRRLVN